MSQLTKNQLESENQSSFPNNTSNYITPQALREFNTDMIQSTVNQTIYTADSASFSQRITQNQGVQGIQGVQGSQGIQGIQGSQGIQGVQGSDATVQGIQGSTGIQGIQGIQGLQGIQGTQSTQGTTGAQGYTGNTGNVGSTGAQGIQGIQGIQGLDGQYAGQGVQGTQGIQGNTGAQGTAGSQGIQGTIGSQGVQGITGTGTQGAQGTAGAGSTISVQDEGTILGNVTSFNFNGAGVTASVSAGTASVTIAGGGGAAFPYTGSAIITGSLVVTGSITEKGDNIYLVNANQTLPFNITQSAGGTNLIFGWNGDSTFVPQSQLTGSFSITGSNNIILTGLIGDESFVADTGFRAYLSGSNNIIYGQNNVFNGILINSSSVMLPKMDSNILGGYVNLGFTSSSLAKPTFSYNLIAGANTQTVITHPSGSVNMTGNLGNRGITSTANKTTLGLLTTIQNNVFIGGAQPTLNHNSSSIQYTGNIGSITVTNNYSSSTSTAVNNVTVANNTFFGISNSLLISGSNTSARRNINTNLVAGRGNIISSEYTGSSVGHLVSTAVIGQELIVSASGTSTTAGGGAFFGRYNDVNNLLADSGKMVFSVGTGTGTSTRKTALSVDSGSNVLVSGSLIVVNSDSSKLSIDANAVVSASKLYAGNSSIGVEFTLSTGSIADSYTRYGKDSFQIYQYQGQQYAFGVICTSDQLNSYTGSQFKWGTVNGTGAIQNYMNMVSASYTGSISAGTPIPGFDYLKNGQILQFNRGTTFDKNVYIQQGLYVSQSVGGATPALTLNGTNGSGALIASGSVTITGSLNLNGQTTFASLDGNTFTNTQTISSSIYIASNNNSNQLYLPSGSNKQTGTFVLDGGNPGTATISNSQVTANSLIFLTKQSNVNGGEGTVSVTSKGSGTFSVTSNHNGDADTVAYMIINPS